MIFFRKGGVSSRIIATLREVESHKLLESQVFDSTLKAKIRFPELFDISPAQGAKREASEAEAARDEANTVKEISERETSNDTAIISQAEFNNKMDEEADGETAQ